jgi:hypothetical protein
MSARQRRSKVPWRQQQQRLLRCTAPRTRSPALTPRLLLPLPVLQPPRQQQQAQAQHAPQQQQQQQRQQQQQQQAPVSVRVQAPLQVELLEGTTEAQAQAALAAAGLAPPLLCKPLWTDGRDGSHKLAVLHDLEALGQLLRGAVCVEFKPPLVVQQYVEHGGVLFKVRCRACACVRVCVRAGSHAARGALHSMGRSVS